MFIFIPSFSHIIVERFASIAAPNEESGSEYRNRELKVMARTTILGDRYCDNAITFLFGHGDLSWSYWGPFLLGENYDRNVVDQMKKGGGAIVHPGYNIALSALFDNGLVGLTLYSVFWIVYIVSYFKSLKNIIDKDAQVILTATFLPVICILICFQFSFDPITPFFWTLTGLHLAARYHFSFAPLEAKKV